MEIVSRSVVYDASNQPPDQQAAYFDSLLQLQSGEWLCGFTAGKTKHHPNATARLARSRNNGQSWELLPTSFSTTLDGVPGSLVGAELVEIDPQRLLLFCTWFDRSEPDRPLFDPQTEGLLRSRQLVAVSQDQGTTWSGWQVVPMGGLTGTAVTGPVLKWSDGSIAYAFESFKEFDDPAPPKHGAWVTVSRDGGRTFQSPFCIATDPAGARYFWDQRLCAGSTPGEFVGLFWTHDRAAQRDLNVHFLQGRIPLDREPGPVDWSNRIATQPVETPLAGQIAAPVLAADGRLFVLVVDRDRPGTITLCCSPDGGRTWPESERLVLHRHDEQAQLSQGRLEIDFAQYWEDMAKWSFGHPTLRPAGQGELLATFYAGLPQCMDIVCVRVRL